MTLELHQIPLIIEIILFFYIMNWKSQYPQARKAPIKENLHGTEISDPYRWLEDTNSEETALFVEQQNELFGNYVNIDKRKDIKDRLLELLSFTKPTSVPKYYGGRIYYWKLVKNKNQPVFVSQTLQGEDEKIILDPNTMSSDGTTAVNYVSFNNDGTLLAYSRSVHGSDWSKVYIKRISDDYQYPDELSDTKWPLITWKNDNSGFYYTKFQNKDSLLEQIYFHKINTSQNDDILIFESPHGPGFIPESKVSTDGKYLIVMIYHGTQVENRVYYKDIENNEEFIPFIDEPDATYRYIGNHDNLFYFFTTLDAPNGKIIAIDFKDKDKKSWKTIISEDKEASLQQAYMAQNDHFVLSYLYKAHNKVKIYKMGDFIRELPLPDMGTISEEQIYSNQKESNVFLLFSSYLFPPIAYHYDFMNDKFLAVIKTKYDQINLDDFITDQVYFPSKDGTKISMYITSKKGLQRNGKNKTILYGYGGFNIVITPLFNPNALYWMERGGVYVEVNLRGGGEYGQKWHRDGMFDKKQNVFDDFISAGEWLIKNNYTSSKHLIIHGGSNGGLLVAACMIQRPDLFGAVLCHVPVIDMLRYHLFTVGRYWTSEYGDPDKPEDFKYLIKYSPLHNIKFGESYPPILTLVADTDDRVVPAHGKKFIAALQEADIGNNPILLRVETKAGHGMGKPIDKIVEERVDIYSFLFKVLNSNG
ncbi:MAG: Prolyl endopeptidase precursor [Candidatus Heimdallarchaeota archaeon LC_3]|nr:MAG: Prolyl endopeptidase precursor [Candidatus Heimdallarchaeota archaeon LC_3]